MEKKWVKMFTFAYDQGREADPAPPPYGQPDRKISVFYVFPKDPDAPNKVENRLPQTRTTSPASPPPSSPPRPSVARYLSFII